MKKLLPILAATLLAASAHAAVETYAIDTTHSSVGFRIRHFVGKVSGSLGQFSGTIRFDREQPEKSSVEATIDVASINTSNDRRDNHLRSDDFFGAATHPKMTFQSTNWQKTGESSFAVTGDLTIKDVTKPVTLEVELLGFGEGSRGAQLSGWEATTKLDRTEFEVGGANLAIGNEVEITITIEAALQS